MRVGRRFTNTAIARRVAIECSRSRHAPSTRCQAPIIPSRRRNGVNEESARSRVDGARCHLRPYELCLVSAGRSSEGIYSGQSACMNCPVFRSAPMPLRTAQIEQPEQPEQPVADHAWRPTWRRSRSGNSWNGTSATEYRAASAESIVSRRRSFLSHHAERIPPWNCADQRRA